MLIIYNISIKYKLVYCIGFCSKNVYTQFTFVIRTFFPYNHTSVKGHYISNTQNRLFFDKWENSTFLLFVILKNHIILIDLRNLIRWDGFNKRPLSFAIVKIGSVMHYDKAPRTIIENKRSLVRTSTKLVTIFYVYIYLITIVKWNHIVPRLCYVQHVRFIWSDNTCCD